MTRMVDETAPQTDNVSFHLLTYREALDQGVRGIDSWLGEQFAGYYEGGQVLVITLPETEKRAVHVALTNGKYKGGRDELVIQTREGTDLGMAGRDRRVRSAELIMVGQSIGGVLPVESHTAFPVAKIPVVGVTDASPVSPFAVLDYSKDRTRTRNIVAFVPGGFQVDVAWGMPLAQKAPPPSPAPPA